MKTPKFIVIDVETTGLNPRTDRLHGIGITTEEDGAQYYGHSDLDSTQLSSWLNDPNVAKVGHNVRFDLSFLLQRGYHVAGPIFDTLAMAQLVNENRPLGLKALVANTELEQKGELDRILSKLGLKHVGELCCLDLSSDDKSYYETIAQYCIEDVNNTYRLFLQLGSALKSQDKLWRTKFNVTSTPLTYLQEETSPLENVLLALEHKGIAVNDTRIRQARTELIEENTNALVCIYSLISNETKEIEDSLFEAAVAKRVSPKGKANVQPQSEKYGTLFNIDSSAHLGELVYNKLGAPAGLRKVTKTGKLSCSEQDLLNLRELAPEGKLKEFLHVYADYKKRQKLLSTYTGENKGLSSTVHDGRIFARYIQAGSSKDGGKGGTVTGRLSSQGPNMQNLPRSGPVKGFFVPDPGCLFIYFDYSQVELRIAAHLSRDPELVNAYVKGLDLHKITASAAFGVDVDRVTKEQRQVGKTLNFALIYDAAAYRLWEETSAGGGTYSIEDCEDMRRAFFRKYSGYAAFLKRVKAFIEANRCIYSATGRVRRLPDIAYGKGLNWQTKTWHGSQDLRQELLSRDPRPKDEYELFISAKKAYKHALKQGYNFPIQSLGASITKRALIELHKLGFQIVTTVHDSVVLQVKEDETHKWRFAQKVLENVYPLSVPLVAEAKLLRSLDESELAFPIAKEEKADIVTTELTHKGVTNESKCK
jgi:DNA polymerase-1